MRKLTTLLLSLLIVSILRAQGIYCLWGMTAYGGPDDAGVIFKTDGRGNNFTDVFFLIRRPRASILTEA